jgi:hypothetical protein
VIRRLRASARTGDESGVILLLVLGFIAFFGLVSVVLLDYVRTNHRATVVLRPIRSAQFAADGAIEGAINRMRQFRPDATVPCGIGSSFYTVKPPLNGQDIVLTCTNPTVVAASPPTLDVTFTAKCPTTGSAACPSGVAMITAKVRFTGTPPAVSATVLNWSVRR